MKLFKCQSCGQTLFFENRSCERCGHRLGYLPDDDQIHALEPSGSNWFALGAPLTFYRFCANAEADACNWLIPIDSPDEFCAACRHNRTIPDISEPDNLVRWSRIERAKHRLFYTLLKLKLPLRDRDEDNEGLAFDFLADPPDAAVMIGHDNGLITLALREADDSEREAARAAMHEPYRTLLGHFRHEIGHYYWDRLVRDGGLLEPCRAVFGDDTEDYGDALKRHYDNGPPPNWQDRYISAYAASHPWEDFAETWAHYLHIVDTLETARAFGLTVQPRLDETGDLSGTIDFNPYRSGTIQQMVEAWLPISFAVNAINRSMGLRDAYPFILTEAVIAKLGFIHALVHGEMEPAANGHSAMEPA